jgi:hypothetical protein
MPRIVKPTMHRRDGGWGWDRDRHDWGWDRRDWHRRSWEHKDRCWDWCK